MYVPLSLAREHCHVTDEVSDTLLQLYVDAAELRVAAFLNRPLDQIMDPVVPPDVADPLSFGAAVRHAILLHVADAVDVRGTVGSEPSSGATAAEILLWPYRIGLGV